MGLPAALPRCWRGARELLVEHILRWLRWLRWLQHTPASMATSFGWAAFWAVVWKSASVSFSALMMNAEPFRWCEVEKKGVLSNLCEILAPVFGASMVYLFLFKWFTSIIRMRCFFAVEAGTACRGPKLDSIWEEDDFVYSTHPLDMLEKLRFCRSLEVFYINLTDDSERKNPCEWEWWI